MKIEAFCLCKSASVNAFNQPTLIDIFDVKTAPSEPFIVEPFVVVLLLRAFREDAGEYRFTVTLRNEAGHIVLGPITDIISFSQLPRDSTTFFHMYNTPRGALPFGKYVFSLAADDGFELARTVLYLEKGSSDSVS